MFAYRPTSTHCFDLVKAMTCGVISGVIICAALGIPIPLVCWFTVGVSVTLSMYIMLCVRERWQHAGRATRFFRYCVFRPLRFIQFCWWLIKWSCDGLKPLEYLANETHNFPGLKLSRRETLIHLHTVSRSMADFDMQRYRTSREILAELRASAPTPYPFETKDIPFSPSE